MFSPIVNRSGPALLIGIGFLLISVGTVGWLQAGNDYERMQRNTTERMFTQALINEFGSRSALRIGEDMSASEQELYRSAARKQIMEDSSNPIHATFRSECRRALLQLVVGGLLTLFAGRIYMRMIRKKGILPEENQQ